MSLLDRQPVRCDCAHSNYVMPDDVSFGQQVECEACGKFFQPSDRELIEVILRWLAGLP